MLSIISLVFTLAVSVVSYLFYAQATRLFEAQLAESIRNSATALLSQHRNSLIEIGTGISLMARGSDVALSEAGLVKYIDNNWDMMSLEWGLESLEVHGVTSKTAKKWGVDHDLKLDALLDGHVAKAPSTAIICRDYCAIYAKIPLLFVEGEHRHLIIGTGLIDFILSFAQKNNLKAALLSSGTSVAGSDTVAHWGVNIAGMTERAQYRPIVDQLSLAYPYDEVKRGGKTITAPDQSSYYVYALALQENTDFLLLAHDVTQEKKLIHGAMLFGGMVMLIGLIGAIIIIFSILNEPMRRIQRQALLLPLLAKKRFEEVREKTTKHRRVRYTRNELDVLEDTAIELSAELQLLHGEIEKRTDDLERMALYDVLTGLANRRMFVEQLKSLIKNSQENHERFAVVFIDLDNFKRINDTLGHDVGDELLIEVSQRLTSAVRDTDIVARLGGDEFTILLPQIESIQMAKAALDKVLAQFQKPVVLNKSDYKITPSIGAAVGPDNGMEPDDLMRCADMAMYKAKKNGKNCYYFFTQEMNDALQDEVKLEAELFEAVNAKEFRLFYQPIVDLKTGNVVGLEGLLRWLHPEKGLLAPIQFLDMLENNGQIVALGTQIFELACLGKRYLNNLGLGHIQIALNISAKQFNDPLLLDKLHTVLSDHNIHPQSFKLEITEQTLMSNIDKQAKQLDILQKLGYQIAIDDFGTGYSSLAYLKALPLDILKIDRSFIKDIPNQKNDMEIVAAVTAMAKKLNIAVVAEGVETTEHEAFLKGIDCEYGQGYLYGKPVPLEEMVDYLQEHAPRPR